MHAAISAEWIKGSGANFAPRPKPWVAKITGRDPKFGLAREFMRATYDYTYARKSGSRGIMLFWC